MIFKENYLGKINITENYIKAVVSKTVSECFGVAGMGCITFKEFVVSKIFRRKTSGMGVSVKIIENEAKIILHISAAYGTNISTVVSSIKNKVRFALTETVGIDVCSVSVFVDEIKI